VRLPPIPIVCRKPVQSDRPATAVRKSSPCQFFDLRKAACTCHIRFSLRHGLPDAGPVTGPPADLPTGGWGFRFAAATGRTAHAEALAADLAPSIDLPPEVRGFRMSYALVTAFLVALVAGSLAVAIFTGFEIAKLVGSP